MIWTQTNKDFWFVFFIYRYSHANSCDVANSVYIAVLMHSQPFLCIRTAFSVLSHSLFCAFAQPFLCCTVAVLSLHHRSTSWLFASILNCENVFAVLMLCTALVQPSYHHYTTMEMRNQHVTVTDIALRNHECIAMHANAERRPSESTASALRQICWSGYFWIFQNSFGLLRPRSIVMRHHCEKCKKKHCRAILLQSHCEMGWFFVAVLSLCLRMSGVIGVILMHVGIKVKPCK